MALLGITWHFIGIVAVLLELNLLERSVTYPMQRTYTQFSILNIDEYKQHEYIS